MSRCDHPDNLHCQTALQPVSYEEPLLVTRSGVLGLGAQVEAPGYRPYVPRLHPLAYCQRQARARARPARPTRGASDRTCAFRHSATGQRLRLARALA